MRVLLMALMASVVFASQPLARAETTDTETNAQLDAGEQALVDLMTDYYGALETWWTAIEKYDSWAARDKAIAAGELVDPNAEYIPRLLAFESEHRGEETGLLALWHVFRAAAGTGRFKAPAVAGRRTAAKRLAQYEQSRLLPFVVSTAMDGFPEPQVYDSVKALCNSPALPSASRKMLRFYLASNSLGTRDSRQYSVKRLDILRAGGEPTWSGELENHLSLLKVWPSAEELNERCVNAMRTLSELAEEPDSPRFPKIERADDRGYLIRLGENSTQPSVAEKATAVLFKERHLKIGAKVPNLEISLIDGAMWRMADQLGKVVIVQFSFTGCGPCERMYPELAALSARYPENLAILTLMSDETPDSVLQAKKSGKLTWSVALDSGPGSIARKWSVSFFPTVYVMDKSGKIAGDDARGDRLQREVERLVQAVE